MTDVARLRTNGGLLAAGYYGPPDPNWPANRAELRGKYYRSLPRAMRRGIFGRWRHLRYQYLEDQG